MAMTFAYDDGYDKNGVRCSVRTVVASWTSSAGGAASGTSLKINGTLLKGVTVPTDGPTADYDITLTDSDGADLLSGCADNLEDRHTSNTETIHFNLTDGSAPISSYPVVNSTVTVTVANAGNTKSGVLTIYYAV